MFEKNGKGFGAWGTRIFMKNGLFVVGVVLSNSSVIVKLRTSCLMPWTSYPKIIHWVIDLEEEKLCLRVGEWILLVENDHSSVSVVVV